MSVMTKRSQRKLFLFGKYSLALLPPKKWLTELGIKKGDNVTLELDRARRRIVVRLAVSEPENEELRLPPTKSEKPTDDWESIPEL